MPANYARFQNRMDAGRQLAKSLKSYAHRSHVLVLGLPRGGVPVAYEVAKALSSPLDICLVRKLGVPGQKELAMGAIAANGVRVLNYDVISWLGISSRVIDDVAVRELRELQRRDRAYRGDRPPPQIRDRTVIVVDDGLATGSSMRAALSVLKAQKPRWLVVAVPVAPPDTCAELQTEVDEVISLLTPENFYAIGVWYEDFAQTTDEEVCKLLSASTRQHPPTVVHMRQ